MGLDERVLVIPTYRFRAAGYVHGFRRADDAYRLAVLDPAAFAFRPRSAVETDPAFKQLIPYVVLRCGGDLFHYRRGSAGTEKRLAALRSVGIGGHIGEADALMHMTGPDAPEVAVLMDEHLTAIAAAPWPEGTLVLLTADHGMEGISPEGTTYVNVVWPELGEHLVTGADGKPLAPAGSCRDLFLHVLPERLDEVEARLGTYTAIVTQRPEWLSQGKARIILQMGSSKIPELANVPVFDEHGNPRHTRGVSESPGLYFVGLTFLYAMTSSMIHGVGRDAQYIAERIGVSQMQVSRILRRVTDELRGRMNPGDTPAPGTRAPICSSRSPTPASTWRRATSPS